MPVIRFHTPHPNDGRDPIALLPPEVMDYLHDLDGVEISTSMLRYIATELRGECGPHFQADIYGDMLSITQLSPAGAPLHHWRAIHFQEINHDESQSQAERSPLPALPDSDRVEACP